MESYYLAADPFTFRKNDLEDWDFRDSYVAYLKDRTDKYKRRSIKFETVVDDICCEVESLNCALELILWDFATAHSRFTTFPVVPKAAIRIASEIATSEDIWRQSIFKTQQMLFFCRAGEIGLERSIDVPAKYADLMGFKYTENVTKDAGFKANLGEIDFYRYLGGKDELRT